MAFNAFGVLGGIVHVPGCRRRLPRNQGLDVMTLVIAVFDEYKLRRAKAIREVARTNELTNHPSIGNQFSMSISRNNIDVEIDAAFAAGAMPPEWRPRLLASGMNSSDLGRHLVVQ
uniref:Uncharacterized protein n=1 Tax=Oryza punctata TaxID=4537 RepID=A0A0E0M476_ORYPU